MILRDFITRTIVQLKEASIDNPQLDARLLVCHGLQCSRLDIMSQPDRLLNKKELMRLEKLIERRLKHEPVARIVGSREFWGLNFALNEATLEPRPDSETLIETILTYCHEKSSLDKPLRILDLGTGTGCLLLALLHELPKATGLGIDIDHKAVEQATKNAASLNLNLRSSFRIGDWLADIDEKFDLIVSNPPYIATSDMQTLMPEVKDFDPLLALDGGANGLSHYQALIPRLKSFLKAEGLIVLEFGIDQAEAVKKLFDEYGYTNIVLHEDLAGVVRCIQASKTI